MSPLHKRIFDKLTLSSFATLRLVANYLSGVDALCKLKSFKNKLTFPFA